MMHGYDDDAPGGTTYLTPQEFSGRRPIGRQYSANDSGIVGECIGSRCGSKVGSSVANDCYSDSEPSPGSPRTLYPVQESRNGHTALCTQFSCPTFTPPSKATREETIKSYEDMSHRHKDDLNVYTAIDDSILLFQSSNSESRADGVPPVCSYRRQLPSRQTSVEQPQAAGRENLLYEHPAAERSRSIQGKGKAKDRSCKSCIHVVFYLLAVAAFIMAGVNFLLVSSDKRYEKLREACSRLSTQNDGLKRSLSDFQNKSNAVMNERLKELNESVASIVSEYDGNISVLLFNLMKNDSYLQQTLFERLDRSVREHFNGLMPINMSQCAYDYRSVSFSADSAEYSTNEHTFNDRFLLRTFCTTEGGTEAVMEFNTNKPNTYKCTCRGKRGEATRRACLIHFWTCPYI